MSDHKDQKKFSSGGKPMEVDTIVSMLEQTFKNNHDAVGDRNSATHHSKLINHKRLSSQLRRLE